MLYIIVTFNILFINKIIYFLTIVYCVQMTHDRILHYPTIYQHLLAWVARQFGGGGLFMY